MRMNMDDDEAAVYMSSNDGAGTIDMHGPIIVEGLLDDDPHHASTCSFPSSSSPSSLSFSPESSSAHVLAAPAPSGHQHQYPEVNSQVAPYGHDHQYTSLHVPAKTGGAFKRYARHLGPKRPPKPGACGHRMFRTAMSVLSKIHEAAMSSHRQQYYYQAPAQQQPPSTQLQHVLSERKRREKLNGSFHALKAVLPPGAKKDKTSILIGAREYVRSLEAKVAELEEKNKSLESLLAHHSGHDDSGETTTKVQVEITRAANEELFTLKIAVRSPSPSLCNMTDVLVPTLQCLKRQIGDGVSLVAMSTADDGDAGTATGGKNASAARAVLTMQIKPPATDWEEQPVKDAVAKVVADSLTTLPPAATTVPPPAASARLLNYSSAANNKKSSLRRAGCW